MQIQSTAFVKQHETDLFKPNLKPTTD
jgi:hypothetical protein